MPCYHPLHGFKSKVLNPSGKRSIVFKLRSGLSSEPVTVPCGRCIGCRLESSRQWALRCVHESQMHEDNAFITLTYAPDKLPYGGTLIKRDFQLFMKRLRRWAGRKLSFYHCGEYGDKSRRPHYHAILFGVRFVDQKPYSRSADGSVLYTSETLDRLWGHGLATVGAVTFESAAYCARYVMKKITGKEAALRSAVTPFGLRLKPYEVLTEDAEIVPIIPEYTTMSLKPAIAKDWYRAFSEDVFPSDEVVIRGKTMKPPKYYDTLLERFDLAAHAAIKEARKQSAKLRSGDNTKRRLHDREQVKLAQTSLLKRTVE